MRSRALRVSCAGLGLVLGLALAGPVQAEEECGAQACVEGASWSSGAQLDDRAREREAKRNRKRKTTQLSIQLEGSNSEGRGSVFIDGVWAATAPARSLPIKPGKHDIEVRDGKRVLARGVLTIPNKAGPVTLRVL